jgi:protein-tyrosine-phosphatase
MSSKLGQFRKHRVLIVCNGNRWRSPVLACLLLREIYRIGRTDMTCSGRREDSNAASPS